MYGDTKTKKDRMSKALQVKKLGVKSEGRSLKRTYNSGKLSENNDKKMK
jgi:hypothetical protein